MSRRRGETVLAVTITVLVALAPMVGVLAIGPGTVSAGTSDPAGASAGTVESEIASAASTLPISEGFDTDSPTNWNFYGTDDDGAQSHTASSNVQVSSENEPSLLLTENDGDQAGTGLYTQPFSSSNGITAEFRYYAAEGTGADGFTFFLLDESDLSGGFSDSDIGDSGGALGYGDSGGGAITGGFIGVGFDEYGNFDESSYSGSPGGDQEITIRGSTDTTEAPVVATNDLSSNTVDGGWRRVRITVDPTAGTSSEIELSVYVDFNENGNYVEVFAPTLYDLGTDIDEESARMPSDLRLGFSGSTGGSTNVHAIDALSVTKPADITTTVTSQPSAGPYEAGDTVEYTFDVTNNGPNDASVTLDPTVATGASGLESLTWDTNNDDSFGDDTGEKTTITLTDGETQTVQLRGTVGDSATGNLDHEIGAVTGADTNDPSPNDANASVSVDLNQAPSFTGDEALADIQEDVDPGSNGGSQLDSTELLGDEFSDADGDSFAGVVVTADASTNSEGTWEYSTDGGSTWYAVDDGSLSASNGLLLSATTDLRFDPATDYNGDPGELTVRAVDDADSTTFTSGSTRRTFDTTADGAASEVASSSNTVGITVTAVDDPPTLSTSSGDSSYTVESGAIVVDDSLTVNDVDGGTIDGAKVSIDSGFASGEDSLGWDSTVASNNGVSGSYDSSTGVLTFTGTATPSEWQAVLRTVTYDNSKRDPSTADRSISFSLGSGGLYNPGTGHYYEFVDDPDIDWDTAKSDAAAKTYFGLQGYLVTVTSQSENDFVASKLSGEGWMGATDRASEGTWKWVTGPEAGDTFPPTGSPDQSYDNWNSGEPNDAGGEDRAHFLTNGEWNDYANGNNNIEGYVVEYGGSAGDPTLDITGEKTVALDDPAPTISNYAVTNPSSQDVRVSFDSTDQLETVSVSISGAESGTLTLSGFTETDNNDGTYTYDATYAGSTDGDYTATLDTAKDAAGNDGAGSESSSVTVDVNAPTLDAATRNTGTKIDVDLSDSGAGFDVSTIEQTDFSLDSGTISSIDKSSLSDGDTGTQTVTINLDSPVDDDTVTVSLQPDGIDDLAGNTLDSGSADAPNMDGVAPTLDGASKVDDTTIDVDLSDSGAGFDVSTIEQGDFSVDSGTISSIDTSSISDGDTGTQTVTINLDSRVDADTVTVSLQSDGIDDMNGNTRTSGSADAPNMDGVAPTLDGASKVDDTTIDVDLSDSGAGFDVSTIEQSDFSVDSGTIASIDTSSISDGDTGTQTVTINLDSAVDADSVTVSLGSDGIDDMNGNTRTSGSADAPNMDGVAPTLDGASKVDDTTIDVDLSDSGAGFDVSTIEAGDFSVDSGTIASIDTSSISDGDTGTQTVTINLDSTVDDDTVTVSLQSDGIDDLNGNTRTSGSADASSMDGVAPTIDSASRVDDTTIDVDLSDAGGGFDVSTIESSDFSLDSGTIASIDKSGIADGDTGTQTVTINFGSAVDDDTVTVSLQSDGIDDKAGNTQTSGSADATGMDGVAPTLDSASKNTDTKIDMDLSDSGSGVDKSTIGAGDFSLDSGTIASIDTSGVTDGGTGTQTVTITLASAVDTDTVTVSLQSDGIDDMNGNKLISGSADATGMDGVAPTITGSTLASDNTYVDVTFGEGVYRSDGSSALTASDLTATITQNSGTVSSAAVSSVTKTDGSSLSGGETTVRVHLSLSGTPADGVETVEIQPADGSSVGDDDTNLMAGSDSTGSIALNDRTAPSLSDDTGTTDEETSAEIVANLLSNDDDQGALSVTKVDGSAGNVGSATAGDNGGLFTIASDGTVDFDPNGDFESLSDTESETSEVTVTVSDAAGNTNTQTVSVTVTGVNDPPFAEAGAEITVRVGEAASLDAAGSLDNEGIDTYAWDVDGDGTADITTNRQETTHTYAQPGTYTAELTVTDTGGNTDSDTVTVTVLEAIDPTADAGDDQTVTAGQSVTLDGSDSSDNRNVTSYEWDVDGDGRTDLTGPRANYTFATAGTYQVTLTVTDDAGNTNSDTVTITVEDGTAPTADAGSNRTVEVGQSIRLDGSGSSDNGNITSYRWDVGSDGVVDATGANASYTFDTVGTYTVALTVTDEAGNTDTDTVTITVEDTVAPTADAGGNQTVTVGETVTFDGTASADNGTIVSYDWDVDGDGTVEASGATATHTYGSAGTYQVTLTVTDTFGSTDADTTTVTVEAATEPSVTVGNQRYAGSTDRITVDSYQFGDVGGSLTVWTVVNGSLGTQIGENLTAPGAGADATVNLTTKLTANTTIAVTIHQNTEPTTANVIATDTATVTIIDTDGSPTGAVTFANQTVANGTMNLTVASASASVNYTVSIRRGSPTGTTLATSRAFAGGTTQQGLDLSLTESLTANTTLYAVVEAADSGDQLANASATITVESDRADDPVEDYDFDDNDNIEIDELGAAAADFAQREISIGELAAVATKFAQSSG